ncbi:hypothetical protein [Picosynechococcus sp. PCC 8807]|uniref:hypothetical protein n=1 Tax=Picosynechococcus sp. PCC 8807 TaxID=195248 RepID=UPI0012EE1E77|nr:hypothetical protein [Picosynechococcus sp. PCC 8807]
MADHSAALARIEAALDGVNGTVQGFWGALADIFESLVSLIRDPIVSALEAQRSFIDGLFGSLEAFISGLFDGIEAAISGAFDATSTLIREFFGTLRTLLEEAFGSVQTALGGIDGNLDNVLSMLGDLSWDVRRALTEINQLDSALSTIQSGINNLDAGQDALNARIVEVRNGLGVIDGRLASLADVVAAINNRTSDIYGRQTELLNRIADVLGAIASVNSALDALESEVREIYGSINALQGEINGIPGEVWGYGLSCGPAGSAVCRSLSAAEDPEKNFSDDDRQKLDDIKDDLDDLGNELEAIAKVTGVPDFPGKLPKSLLGDDNLKGTEEVESIPQFILWLTKQLDALVGEFPVSIEVTDNDLTQSGNQKQTIQLRNIAEAFAELYGQGVLTTTHQSVQTNGLVRVGTELTSLKVMVAVAQDLIMATTEFLGFKTKQKRRNIDTSFTLKKSGDNNYTLANFLDSDKISYKGYEFDDDDILIEYLPQLMYGVSLIKAATLRGEDDVNEIEDRVKEVLEDGASAWDKFQEIVNNPDSEYNIDQDVKFKITDRDVEIDE